MRETKNIKRKKPKVSVIIPCYNHSNYLPRTVNSILKQTFKDFEIVIIDDGSTDNSAEVAKSLALKDKRIRFFQNKKNLGVPKTFNRGIKLAMGKYIYFTSADDIGKSNALKKMSSVLDDSPKTGIVFSDFKLIDEKDNTIGQTATDIKKKDFLNDYIYNIALLHLPTMSNPLIRKECFDKVGLSDEQLPVSEDTDLFTRICKYYKVAYIREPLALFRVYKNKKSYGSKASIKACEYSWLRIANKNINELNLNKKQKNIIYSHVYYHLLRQALGQRRNLKKAVFYFFKLIYLDFFFMIKRIYGKIHDKIMPDWLPWIVLHDAKKLRLSYYRNNS